MRGWWRWLVAALSFVGIVMFASSSSSPSLTAESPPSPPQQPPSQQVDGHTQEYVFQRPPESGISELTLPRLTRGQMGVLDVTASTFGLIGRYEAQTEAQSTTWRKNRNGTRVVVEMSGHMRTYARCAPSLRQHLLDPNDAKLVIATYPDVGNKRYGVRDFSRDAVVDIAKLPTLYGEAHLAAIHLLDYPTVALAVRRAVRTADHHFSWVLYQLIAMELGHNLTMQMNPADVAVRVRPDLFVMGPVLFAASLGGTFTWSYRCGNLTFNASFGGAVLLQAPHHTRLQWGPIAGADHSLVGVPATMRSFAGSFFTELAHLSPEALNATYFHRGNYVEKMWLIYAKQHDITLRVVAGWHVVLRDVDAYRNTTVFDERSKKRKAMLDAIFGVTDPAHVPCPRPNGLTTTTLDGRAASGRRKH